MPLRCRCKRRRYDMYKFLCNEQATSVMPKEMVLQTSPANTTTHNKHQLLPRPSPCSDRSLHKRTRLDRNNVTPTSPYRTRTSIERPYNRNRRLNSARHPYHRPPRLNIEAVLQYHSRPRDRKRTLKLSFQDLHLTNLRLRNMSKRLKKRSLLTFRLCCSQRRMNTLQLPAVWDP